MAMIAFAAFVIVAHRAQAVLNVGRTVFVVMLARGQGFGQLPDDNFTMLPSARTSLRRTKA
jgi:hypothetical protein